MAKRKWSGLVAIGVAALVLLGTGLGVVLAGFPYTDASAKPSDEIAKSICQFEGTTVADLRLMSALPNDTLTRLMSGKTQYGFNPQSKQIELAYYGGNLVGNETVLITEREAEDVATQFARKHCSNLPIFTLHRSELRGLDGFPDSASVMRAYEFEWVQVIDTALTPNSVLVQVNPGTGKIMAYIYRYQPIQSAGAPSLTKDSAKAIVASRVLEVAKAISIAESTLSPEVSFLQEPELRIVVKDEKQMLVWRMTAEAQGELPWTIGGQFDVDAQNGSIEEENLFL